MSGVPLLRRDGVLVSDPVEPLRPEAFTSADEPLARAEQLGRLQRAVSEAVEVARGRRGRSRLYEVTTGTGGAALVIEHRLGRVARWAVVDWARTTPGGTHGLERSVVSGAANDANTLTLRSYVAGTATIEVW